MRREQPNPDSIFQEQQFYSNHSPISKTNPLTNTASPPPKSLNLPLSKPPALTPLQICPITSQTYTNLLSTSEDNQV